MSEYEKAHVDGVVIENESSGTRGLPVYASVDTLGAVIIEFGSSMTIRTDRSGARALTALIESAISTLDKKIERTTLDELSEESVCQDDLTDARSEINNDPVNW